MGRPRKYKTEEERKAAQREYQKLYRQKNKEYFAEYQTKYLQNNKEKRTEYFAEYYQNNKEKRDEYFAEYRQNNKDKIAEYKSTPYGRASNLNCGYKRNDKNVNRGECTLTPQWIVDNIFSQPCHYCGETDWRKIGCDRIDNTKPHTQDNVVPCCSECNKKRNTTPYDEFMKIMGKVV